MLGLKYFIDLLMGRTKANAEVVDKAKWHAEWTIEKYHGEACPANLYAVEQIDGNLLLNEGITLLLNLLIGAGGTAYNNANTYIGVGDSSTAAAASQTGLLASTNKAYLAMDTGYPQVSGQTVTWRATAGASVANYAWNEFTVVNASSDSGTNLNRKVESHSTKTSGDTWVIQCAITIS